MEVKPGYKQTEVGVIPEDWTNVPLESIVVSGGLVRGPFGGAIKKQFFVADGYKVYEQRNAIYKDSNIGNYFVTDEKYRELDRFKVKINDLIVSCSGTIGCIYRIPEGSPSGIINQALLKITLNENIINSNYFLNVFQSESFQDRITDSSHGGAMQNLVGMDTFRNTLLSLPPLAEQESIAEALSDADALIESLEQLITKKRQIKQGAMQELLRPKQGWIEKKLKSTATLKARIGWQGLTTDEYLDTGDYYLVTGTDFKNGYVDWDNCHFVDFVRYKQDRNIQLREHDVLVTKDGTIGKVALVGKLSRPATLNSGVFVIRPVDDAFHPEFFYYLLCSNIFTEFLNQLSAGSTINHLYQKDFVNFTYKTPSTRDEQVVIAKILTDMDAETSALEAKLSKARQVKQGMMQELLTGRIRLV